MLQAAHRGRGPVGVEDGHLAEAVANADGIQKHFPAGNLRENAEAAGEHDVKLRVDVALAHQHLARRGGHQLAVAAELLAGLIVHEGQDSAAG
ncbi:MAG: hypothetical protein WDO13_14290 [Verrucomicrobiota bacterium]